MKPSWFPSCYRYWLEHYDSRALPQFDARLLSPHKREVARAMTAGHDVAFGGEAVVKVLEAQDDHISADRFFTREAVVLEALLSVIGCKSNVETVGSIAKWANLLLEGRGEKLELSAKAVGAILRRLDFR